MAKKRRKTRKPATRTRAAAPRKKTVTRRKRRSRKIGLLSTNKLNEMLMPVVGAVAAGFVSQFLKNEDGTDKFFAGSSTYGPMVLGFVLSGQKGMEGLGQGMFAVGASKFVSSQFGIGAVDPTEEATAEVEMLKLAQKIDGFNDAAAGVAGFNTDVPNVY